MTRIGLLSDTHSFLHPKIFEHFSSCDEIWHAGDIGNAETIYELRNFKPVRAVYGNIDGYSLRSMYPETGFISLRRCKGYDDPHRRLSGKV